MIRFFKKKKKTLKEKQLLKKLFYSNIKNARRGLYSVKVYRHFEVIFDAYIHPLFDFKMDEKMKEDFHNLIKEFHEVRKRFIRIQVGTQILKQIKNN